MKILLIDDNEMMRRILIQQLKEYAEHITECEDGLKGVMAYQQLGTVYSFVIVDYQMPSMCGITVIGEIRRLEGSKGWRQVPIMCIEFFVL